MTSEYDLVTNTQPYAEDLGIDLPVEYGVVLIGIDGDEIRDARRWKEWDHAAQHAEEEVKSGRAKGFRIFNEAAV